MVGLTERLTEKQRRWLVDSAKELDLAIQKLTEFLKKTKQKGPEFWKTYGMLERQASDAIYRHLAAKHKIAKTYYSDEFTKEHRLLKHMIALRVYDETGFAMPDWIIKDEEELEWCLAD